MYYNLFLGPSGAHGRPGDRGEPGRPGMNFVYYGNKTFSQICLM